MTDLVARIAALWRYPVKSCAGEAVDTLMLDEGGWPQGDRGWGVVDAAGELTWMGAHPRLALVRAALTPHGLVLHAGGRSLTLPLDDGTTVEVRGWNGERQDFDALQAWDAGDAAATLLRETTGATLRLVRLSLTAQRRPILNALHLLGDGSLQAWCDASTQALSGVIHRTRPNVVLEGEDGSELPPFIEDIIVNASVGSLSLRRTAACVRCVMTTIDPVSTEAQPAALDALTRLSAARAPGAPVQFGIYVRADGAGVLRVGDRVELRLDFGER
jgi:uncharacterized protein